MHWVGVFDFLELKTYDYRFHSVRGPLTGWRASDSTIIDIGTDVVLVDVDDETWRLLAEKEITWPYSRGDIWAKVVENISKAGAKIIAFDIQFDCPDTRSEYLRSVSSNLPEEFRQYLPGHGDVILADAIRNAQDKGTRIVMDTKLVRESSRNPPEYIMEPVKLIMEAEPATGLINDLKDIDGFSREYSIAGFMDHEPGIPYPTLGLKCVQEYFDISDTVKLVWNKQELVWTLGPLNIQAHGKTNSFLVNYYGPPSGYKLPGTNYPTWGTFPSYSLSQVLDTQDFELSEDLDWMSQFIPGEIPNWILSLIHI